jgi:hypothetical protein
MSRRPQHPRQAPLIAAVSGDEPVENALRLIEAVLSGFETPAERARWVLRNLPRTAVLLGVEAP